MCESECRENIIDSLELRVIRFYLYVYNSVTLRLVSYVNYYKR